MAAPTMLEPRATPTRLPGEEALYEVVNGQRVELAPMRAYASWVTSRLQNRLGPFAEAHELGNVVTETLFILDAERDLRRRPDVAFVSAETWPLDRPIPETGDWEVVPDLAVEVVSPKDLYDNVLAKMHEYFDNGVRQVWIVAPTKQQVYVYDSPTQVHVYSAANELDGGKLLPGFRLPVASLFQQPTEAGKAAQA